MKTLFSVGFQASQNVWDRRAVSGVFMGQSPRSRLGQLAPGSVPSGTLTLDQKNAVYALLKDAMTKVTELDTWIHSVGEDGQAAAMGTSFDIFRSYINHAADLGDTIWPMYNRLGGDNPEDQYILPGDEDKVVDFVNTVNQAYSLYGSKVKGGGAPVSAPFPVVQPTGTAPAAATPPVTQKPAGAGAKGIAPAPPMVLGVPQSVFIGGGILAALGIVTYALVK